MGVRSGEMVLLGHETRRLGGHAFDEALARHFAQEFQRKYKMDPMEQRKARVKLTLACERTKISLSASMTGHISVESLCDGMDFNGNIPRHRFDALASPVADHIVGFVKDAVASFGVGPGHFDQVRSLLKGVA
jgi:molecular chaperone DnaK (HSP70)